MLLILTVACVGGGLLLVAAAVRALRRGSRRRHSYVDAEPYFRVERHAAPVRPPPPSPCQIVTVRLELGPINIPPGTVALPPYDPEPRRRTVGAAIRFRWKLQIIYCAATEEWTAREVSPRWLGGAASGGEFGNHRGRDPMIFGGYCHLRQEPRHFRLDRVLVMQVAHDDPKIRAKYNVR